MAEPINEITSQREKFPLAGELMKKFKESIITSERLEPAIRFSSYQTPKSPELSKACNQIFQSAYQEIRSDSVLTALSKGKIEEAIKLMPKGMVKIMTPDFIEKWKIPNRNYMAARDQQLWIQPDFLNEIGSNLTCKELAHEYSALLIDSGKFKTIGVHPRQKEDYKREGIKTGEKGSQDLNHRMFIKAIDLIVDQNLFDNDISPTSTENKSLGQILATTQRYT